MASNGTEDLSQLPKLDEDAILAALRDRYARDEIYTNCGEILIAVNPYKKLQVFDIQYHEKYDWRKFDAVAPPHIFNVAARAYQRMRESEVDQVILVSGESGAGKTESTKLMVKHFIHMCPHGSEDLHDKVVKVNPLLEAFGNAQTIMNENSSRFAKYLELSFEENGQVLGAVIRDYMLEKSRVVNFSFDEGNFHIFYSLFAGASKEQLSELSLTEAKNYKIMTQGSPRLLNRKQEYQQMYADQMSILKQIGFTTEDMNILHCMLGAIIHLTEIKFKEAEKQNEPIEIVNIDHVETVAKLLNLKSLDLAVALIKTKTDYGGFGGEEVHVLKSLVQARDGRDALAKSIYERLFGWVIRRINEDLNPSKQRNQVAAHIGILDIAGFENLHVNSFEQLCINFVNERLQHYMNDNVFKTEKRLYKEEGIKYADVDFKNNEDIIDIFTRKSIGILTLLDEETTFQQGSDDKFVQKVTNNHCESGIVSRNANNDPVFGIQHFAGKVMYSCQGFLEKNKDTLNDDLFDCMKESGDEFVHDLFVVAKGPTGTISETQFRLRQSRKINNGKLSASRRGKPSVSDDAKKLGKELGRSIKRYGCKPSMASSYSPKNNNTVLTYFRTSMDKLLEKMKRAEAHFVRCIKPNGFKQQENFNAKMVKDQLLYNGITEIAKIRKQGFPVRSWHKDFYRRYCVLHGDFQKKTDKFDLGVKSLIGKVLPDRLKTECEVGKHKVFMKEPVHMFLEKLVYIRERVARHSMENCIWNLWSEKKKAEQLEKKRKQEEAYYLKKEIDRKREEDERRERERKLEMSTKPRINEMRSSISSTRSTNLGNSDSSGTSEGGMSSSDSSSSNPAPFAHLSKTRGPRGEFIQLPNPDDKAKGPHEKKPPPPAPRRDKRHPYSENTAPKIPFPPEDDKKKKEQKAFWDIFANIPREKKSQDVHERGSLRVIKILTYCLLFLILLAALVFQKISLMLLVHRQDRKFSNTLNHKNKDEQQKDYKEQEVLYNSARYLLLLVAMCIPYALTFLMSFLKMLFGNSPYPSKGTIIVSVVMETAHSVGLGYLVFKYLGEMHAARGIMVMSATCILPSILKPFFAKDQTVNGNGRGKVCKKIFSFVFDLLAIIVQISVIPVIINLGFIIGYDPSKSWETIVEVVFCLLLCSFSWWENFMDDRAFGTRRGFLQQFILQIKFDLQESRPMVTLVTSSFKIGMTIAMAVILKDGLNLHFSDVMGWISNIRYENGSKITYDPTKDFTSIICITVGSYVAYYLAYTVCKLRMQIVSFSMAALLSTPVAVLLVWFDCRQGILEAFTKEQLYCYDDESYNSIHWYHFLFGFLWLVSAHWITRHVWFPHQERLAKIERLFVNPLYCSILLEQHLLMNRRRHTRRIRKEADPGHGNRITYRLSEDEKRNHGGTDRSNLKQIPPMIYACATMWHENRLEMVQLLKSLYRVDLDQFIRKNAVILAQQENPEKDIDPEEYEYYEFQTHILFDDAFEFDDDEDRVPNSFVKLFMEVMQEAANAIYKKEIKLAKPMIIPSPYGAQLVFDMPGENFMYVHLKDKNNIRHRKRWSQVMYMYYLLGYRIIKECQERVLQALEDDKINDLATWNSQSNDGKVGKGQIFNILDDEVLYRAENTFILALDGDVDFTPKAVRLLIDRMKKNELLGASCGRIHPIGKGPMVWYQKFEYAVAHWLQKSTEHVLGCVLCSPGCFSLFRGAALMDDNIMRKYTIKPTEASHHLMYDQGEDRWLCTLLLQQGYRVDYAAASDAFTYAPEGFGEFFNQRRRWMPSTIANIMDLLTDASNTVSINKNISWLYIVYQAALMVSTLIGPSTVIMMIAGAYLTVFSLDLITSYIIALTPALIYTILCFTVKSKYQIMAAEIFSALYSFIMMVVFVGCIVTAVKESPFHPSVIFLCAMVFIFLFAAVIHPWEASCIIYGALYFLCVPSGFLLLVIYSLVNMNVVSWGTREVPKKKTKAEIEEEEKLKKEKEEKKKQGWFSRLMPKFGLQDLKGLMEFSKNEKEDKSIQLLEQMNKNMEKFIGMKPESSELKGVKVEPKGAKPKKMVSFAGQESSDEEEVQKDKKVEEEEYIYQKKKKEGEMKWLKDEEFRYGTVMTMNPHEKDFWKNFIKKYLEPLVMAESEKKKTAADLIELRNNVVAGFAFINLIWVAINFMFQLKKPAVITFPTYSENKDEVNEDNIKIDALGLMFVIFFVVILFIQFVGMIIHRWGTFMHLIAITEIPNPCKKSFDEQTNNEKKRDRNPKDMVRLCQELIAEPVADYPSDEEDEETRENERLELLKEKINNLAEQGVVDNLRDSRRNIGISLRDTRAGHGIGRSLRQSSGLGRTVRDANFQRNVGLRIAKSRREITNDDESGFRPNNVRQRAAPRTDQAEQAEPVRKFGHTTPIFSNLIEKIAERNLETKIDGMQRETTGGNLRRTFRPGGTVESLDEDNIYDEIPGAGTLSRAFHKKLHKISKTGIPSSSNGNITYRTRGQSPQGTLNSAFELHDIESGRL